jgi:uroporphyrinogen III methyltransferase/synthase
VKNAFVALVGAGPGDRELITLKGWRYLRQAEAVFYDYLVNERLLNACPESCRAVYVGKSARHHSMKQEDIHELILQSAREGRKIVRLKGGDPFVFGRGAEEVAFLEKQGIAYDIVPGVTAANGAAASLALPLTHRNLTLSCTFLTGHLCPERVKESLSWKDFVHRKETLVFYMGMKNLPGIVEHLIKAGFDPETPALAVQQATSSRQRTVRAHLKNLLRKVEAEQLTAPALLFFGKVADLARDDTFLETRPHFAKSLVFVGRFRQREEELDALEREGAFVVELPVLKKNGEPFSWRQQARSLVLKGEIPFFCFEDLKSFEAFRKELPEWKHILRESSLGTFDPSLPDLWRRHGLSGRRLDKIEDVWELPREEVLRA